MLFGPAPRLETLAGFTLFKVQASNAVVAGIFSLVLTTTTLRGIEESGQLELLLLGATTRVRVDWAADASLVGVGTVAAILGAVAFRRRDLRTA